MILEAEKGHNKWISANNVLKLKASRNMFQHMCKSMINI